MRRLRAASAPAVAMRRAAAVVKAAADRPVGGQADEVGTLQPIAEIGRLCRARGIILHSDAVQAAGRVPVDVDAGGVDQLSLSRHKM